MCQYRMPGIATNTLILFSETFIQDIQSGSLDVQSKFPKTLTTENKKPIQWYVRWRVRSCVARWRLNFIIRLFVFILSPLHSFPGKVSVSVLRIHNSRHVLDCEEFKISATKRRLGLAEYTKHPVYQEHKHVIFTK